MNINYYEAPKTEKVYQVVLALNRRARLESFKLFLIPEDFELFMKTSTNEDIDDFHMHKVLEIANRHLWKYERKFRTTFIRSNPVFDPTRKEDFFHDDCLVYLAYDKEVGKTIGYSAWTSTKQLKEQNIAQQVFVLPDYRRKGIATQLLKIHLPFITGIFADTCNNIGKRIYEKNFDLSKVVFGKIHYELNNRWIPANGKEYAKQIRLFDYDSLKEEYAENFLIFLEKSLTTEKSVMVFLSLMDAVSERKFPNV